MPSSASSGSGLALVYKATRILNFAQGELGTLPAFVALLVMTGLRDHGGDKVADRGLLLPATLAAIVGRRRARRRASTSW